MNLPVLPRPQAAPANPVPATVLIVDDHTLFREGLRCLIERRTPFKVCAETDNAPEAISLAVQHAPSLAIVDISLRSTNGIELTKSLCARCPDLKVLVLSAMNEEVYAERALRAGARGFLMKLAASEELAAALQTIERGGILAKSQQKESSGRRTLDQSGGLSDREVEVLMLLGNGLTTRAIAEQLKLSIKTIDTYRDNLKRKLHLSDGNQLVHYAVQWAKTQEAV